MKMMKKEPEVLPQLQNPLRSGSVSNAENMEDSLKLEEWPFHLNLSRGNSQTGDFNLSRFNSLSGPRIPSSLEVNFAQSKFLIKKG